MKIKIVRPTAPTTHLFVEVIAKDLDQLGKNRPVVFILPGGPGADHTVYKSYTCLEPVADLVFHDPRGCGESDTGESSSYNMFNYIEDVEAIRKHLGIEKLIVLGKSYGAMCALGYALQFPNVLTKLIVSAGAPSARFMETTTQNIERVGTPQQIKMYQQLKAGALTSREDVLKYFQATQTIYSVKSRTSTDDIDLVKKSLKFSHEVLNEGFKQNFWNFNYEEKLKDIQCPTLILAGREDIITDVRFSEWMVQHIPNSQLRVFENASHAMEADATEEYFQTIVDFINAH